MRIIMKLIISLIFFLFFVSDSQAYNYNNFKNVEFVKNYDGDTFTVNIANVHPLLGLNANIRIRGIDTAEIYGDKKCEKEKALEAKLFLNKILSQASTIDLLNIERGKYFRLVSDVLIDNKISINNLLLEKNLAIPYNKRNELKDWCSQYKELIK